MWTLLGPTFFNSSGLRQNPGPNCTAAWTRQYVPLAESDHVNKYLGTSLETIPGTGKPLYYPMLDKRTRTQNLYPCAPGCYFERLECRECPVGYFRAAESPVCMRCSPGTFNNETGMDACQDCPKDGVDCQDRILPKPIADFHLYTRVDILDTGLVSAKDAVKEDRPDNCPSEKSEKRSHFVLKCLSKGVCLAHGACSEGNTGLICGQCEDGYSYDNIFGGNPGKRMCVPCMGSMVSYGCFAFVFMLYYTLLHHYQRSGSKVARNMRTGNCPTIRVMVHYLQLLCCALEAVHLDGHEPASFLLMPIMWVFRPLNLVWWDCTFADLIGIPGNAPTAQIWDKVRASAALLPFGICALLALHFGRQYFAMFLQITNARQRIVRFIVNKKKAAGIPAKWQRKWYKVGPGAGMEVLLIRKAWNQAWVVAKPDLSLGILVPRGPNVKNTNPAVWGEGGDMQYQRVPRMTRAIRYLLTQQADRYVASHDGGSIHVTMPKDGDIEVSMRVKHLGRSKEDLPTYEDPEPEEEDEDPADRNAVDFEEEPGDEKGADFSAGDKNGIRLDIHQKNLDGTGAGDQIREIQEALGATKQALEKISLTAADKALGRVHSTQVRTSGLLESVGIHLARGNVGPLIIDFEGLNLKQGGEKDTFQREFANALNEKDVPEDCLEGPQGLQTKVYLDVPISIEKALHLKAGASTKTRVELYGVPLEEKHQRAHILAILQHTPFVLRGIEGKFAGADSKLVGAIEEEALPVPPARYHLEAGPGQKYNYLHVKFDAFDKNVHLWRKLLCFGMVIHAPLLRGIADGFMCTTVVYATNGERTSGEVARSFVRISSMLDVECDALEMASTRYSSICMFGFAATTLPILLWYILRRFSAEYACPDYRRALVVFTVGYKPQWSHFEVLRMMKMSSVVFAATYVNDANLRVASMIGVLVVFLILQLVVRPYAILNRFLLPKLDILATWSVICVLGISMIIHKPPNQPDIDQVVSGISQDALNSFLLLAVVVLNGIVILYGAFILIFQDLLMNARIFETSGMKLGGTTLLFVKIIRQFWTLNTVSVYQDETHTTYVDSERLHALERNFLKQSMNSLLKSCVLCGSKFYPSMLVICLQEGFAMATKARAAHLRHRDETLGIGSHEVVRGGGFSWGSVFQNAPDIIPSNLGEETGVTVEEMGDAFECVKVDIHDNHPHLHFRMRQRAASIVRKKQDYELREWHAAEPFDSFLQELTAAGRCSQPGENNNYCRGYAHEFEQFWLPAKDMKWKCMQFGDANTAKSGCQLAMTANKNISDGEPRPPPNYGNVFKYKCVICGLEVCGPCQSWFALYTLHANAHFVEDEKASSADDPDNRIQALKEQKLLDMLSYLEEETFRLEKMLTRVAIESEYKQGDKPTGTISTATSVTNSLAPTPAAGSRLSPDTLEQHTRTEEQKASSARGSPPSAPTPTAPSQA